MFLADKKRRRARQLIAEIIQETRSEVLLERSGDVVAVDQLNKSIDAKTDELMEILEHIE